MPRFSTTEGVDEMVSVLSGPAPLPTVGMTEVSSHKPLQTSMNFLLCSSSMYNTHI